jgi:Alpha/beta hydrolase
MSSPNVFGAEVESLRVFAKELAGWADALESEHALMNNQFLGLDWFGEDRSRFAGMVQQHKEKYLNGLARYLRSTDEFLRKQAGDQEKVSSDGVTLGGAVSGIGALLGLSRLRPSAEALLKRISESAADRPWDASALASNGASMVTAWSALSAGDRTALINTSPELIRNLDGIPPADRIAANRVQMERDLSSGKGDLAILKSLLASNTQVILYRPEDGQIAIVHGNIATANTVIVTVPGTGTQMSNYVEGGIENSRAYQLQQRAHQVSGQHIAVVAWLGYQAPQWNVAENPGKTSFASEGGVSLSSFGAGLGILTSQRLTAVGHSYGSTVVGYGARNGLAADNIVVLGSPGMSVNKVGALNLRSGAEVFAMRSTLDPVGGLSAFGTEPTSSAFGAQRLASNSDGLFTHSDYWTHDNLNQIALAATDGKPKVVLGPQSPGEALTYPNQFLGGYLNNGIDSIQKHIPTPLDGLVDKTQQTSQTIMGIGNTLITEGVDVGIKAGREIAGAVVDAGDAVVDGIGAAGSAIGDAGGAVLNAGGKAVSGLKNLFGDD